MTTRAVDPQGGFSTLRRARPMDRAVDANKQHSIVNALQPGDRLPAEPELARSLGVSRNIVRLALSSLETDDVEAGVEDLAQRVDAGAAPWRWRREVRLQKGILGVSEVAGVRCSVHAPPHRTGRVADFSDGL